MGKVDENKQQKKQRLMDTAFSLFTSKGIVKTSISDIVEQAKVAKGTFYLYFRDKYDVQEKLITYKANQMIQHALNTQNYFSQNGCENKLIAIIDDILDQMQENPDILRFINKNLSWGLFRHALASGNNDYLNMFREIIREDEHQWENPEIMLYTIIELVSSTCHSVVLDNDPISLEEFKPMLYRSIRAIIRTYRVN